MTKDNATFFNMVDIVQINEKLTVSFDDPFWVGVFERIENGKLSVSKVTFGAEPKDYEVLEYITRNYYRLKFSPAVDTVVRRDRAGYHCGYRVYMVFLQHCPSSQMVTGTQQSGMDRTCRIMYRTYH